MFFFLYSSCEALISVSTSTELMVKANNQPWNWSWSSVCFDSLSLSGGSDVIGVWMSHLDDITASRDLLLLLFCIPVHSNISSLVLWWITQEVKTLTRFMNIDCNVAETQQIVLKPGESLFLCGNIEISYVNFSVCIHRTLVMLHSPFSLFDFICFSMFMMIFFLNLCICMSESNQIHFTNPAPLLWFTVVR